VQTPEAVRVLLIEDDPEFAELYRLRLESDDYQVNWAPDGATGLAAAATWRPDLIFLDIRMPQMGGIQVLRELRSRDETRDVPVVVLSNYSDPDLRRQAGELGALEWVVKVDATPAGLSDRIARWTNAQAAE
jgi:CheY-like chemotaxis protein